MKSREIIKKEYQNKTEEIKKHNILYYDKSRPIISDSEYDVLKRDIIELENKYSYLKK